MINADGVNAAGTGNTATQYYGNVWASPQGTAVTGAVNAIISIEYIVDFFSPKQVVDN